MQETRLDIRQILARLPLFQELTPEQLGQRIIEANPPEPAQVPQASPAMMIRPVFLTDSSTFS